MTAKLHAALAAAFAEFEGATKGNVNPHFKSKYADLSAVIDAVKPALVNHGLFFTQAMHDAQGGVCVETVIHHSSGESLSCGSLFVPASKNDAQGFGSALTYCRRYSLMTAFGIPAEDDDGNAAARTSPPAAANQGNGVKGNPAQRDAPFPLGPAKNKTELKTLARAFWHDVEGCGDPDQLEILLKDKGNVSLVAQLVKALPDWWEGGRRDSGEQFEGLEAVISRKQGELSVAAMNAG